jgi:hypothetical protein
VSYPVVHPVYVVRTLILRALRENPALLDAIRADSGQSDTDVKKRISRMPFKSGTIYPAVGFHFLGGTGKKVLGDVEVWTTTRWSILSVVQSEILEPIIPIDTAITDVMTKGIGWPTFINDHGIVFSCIKGDPLSFTEVHRWEDNALYEHLGNEWLISARGRDNAGQI